MSIYGLVSLYVRCGDLTCFSCRVLLECLNEGDIVEGDYFRLCNLGLHFQL